MFYIEEGSENKGGVNYNIPNAPMTPPPAQQVPAHNYEEYILVPKKEFERLRRIETEHYNPCEHCQYYNKPIWIIPEAHPCRNCRKRNDTIFPIITCEDMCNLGDTLKNVANKVNPNNYL